MPDKKPSAWRYLWYSQDIRSKLLITLGILMLFRLAANVPAPGVDREALQAFFSGAGSGGFLGFLNLLSGGTPNDRSRNHCARAHHRAPDAPPTVGHAAEPDA
jgi:preprotein translocase subunit SecY